MEHLNSTNKLESWKWLWTHCLTSVDFFVMCSYQFILCLVKLVVLWRCNHNFCQYKVVWYLILPRNGNQKHIRDFGVKWHFKQLSHNLPWTQTCKLNNSSGYINPTSKVCCQKIYRQACLKSSLARKVRSKFVYSDIAEPCSVNSICPTYLNIWFYQTL